MCNRLGQAYVLDQEANKKGVLATHKMKLLPEVRTTTTGCHCTLLSAHTHMSAQLLDDAVPS